MITEPDSRNTHNMTPATAEMTMQDIPARVNELAAQVAYKIHQELGEDTSVIWFGSWIRGDASLHSEIDLAVISPNPIEPVKLAGLRQWIDDLPTLFSIDLVNLDDAAPQLVNEILNLGVRLG